MLLVVEQYCSDRFYGRFIFLPAFTQEYFTKPSLLGGFRCITNLTLVNVIFFLRDIVVRDFYCIYIYLYAYYCVELIERKGGALCVPTLVATRLSEAAECV